MVVHEPILIKTNILHRILVILVTPQKQLKKERLINTAQVVLLLHYRLIIIAISFSATIDSIGIATKFAKLNRFW